MRPIEHGVNKYSLYGSSKRRKKMKKDMDPSLPYYYPAYFLSHCIRIQLFILVVVHFHGRDKLQVTLFNRLSEVTHQ
jgi:hypothetical protein